MTEARKKHGIHITDIDVRISPKGIASARLKDNKLNKNASISPHKPGLERSEAIYMPKTGEAE